MDAQNRKERVALLSVISNTTLVVMKLIVGVVIGSVSVISEAIHSGVDLVAAIIALFSVKTSSLPADGKHPFGHGKIENISGTVEALLIFVAAGWIIWEAVRKLLEPQPMETVGWGVAVMLFSAVANYCRRPDACSRWGRRPIRSPSSPTAGTSGPTFTPRRASWSASPSSGAASSSSPGTISTGWTLSRPSASPALIIKAAWDLTRQSAGGLMDETLPPEEEEEIRRLIRSQLPLVHGLPPAAHPQGRPLPIYRGPHPGGRQDVRRNRPCP